MSYLELAKRKAKELGLDRNKDGGGQQLASGVKAGSNPAQAREEIDGFWSSEILPKLASLHRAGRLPDLMTDPLWKEAERIWNTLAVDCNTPVSVEEVKGAMLRAVASYQGKGPAA
ncbi:MAG: hypothetical protein WAO55_01165 [Candidatus Manganitrophaceae bacterium]